MVLTKKILDAKSLQLTKLWCLASMVAAMVSMVFSQEGTMDHGWGQERGVQDGVNLGLVSWPKWWRCAFPRVKFVEAWGECVLRASNLTCNGLQRDLKRCEHVTETQMYIMVHISHVSWLKAICVYTMGVRPCVTAKLPVLRPWFWNLILLNLAPASCYFIASLFGGLRCNASRLLRMCWSSRGLPRRFLAPFNASSEKWKMPIEDKHFVLAPNPTVLLGICAPSSVVSVASGWWVAAVGFVVVCCLAAISLMWLLGVSWWVN